MVWSDHCTAPSSSTTWDIFSVVVIVVLIVVVVIVFVVAVVVAIVVVVVTLLFVYKLMEWCPLLATLSQGFSLHGFIFWPLHNLCFTTSAHYIHYPN